MTTRAWADAVAARIGAKAPGLVYRIQLMAAVGVVRAYLTWPCRQRSNRFRIQRHPSGDHSRRMGGLDDYLKTIETEVKPRVRAAADAYHLKLNDDDQTLFGHSLGGLAVLEALFTEPKAFRTFVAASPRVWCAGRGQGRAAERGGLRCAGRSRPRN